MKKPIREIKQCEKPHTAQIKCEVMAYILDRTTERVIEPVNNNITYKQYKFFMRRWLLNCLIFFQRMYVTHLVYLKSHVFFCEIMEDYFFDLIIMNLNQSSNYLRIKSAIDF